MEKLKEKQQGKELAKTGSANKNALAALADRLQISQEELTRTLKETAFKECKTDAQFIAALVVANTYGLNPLLKEVTAFPGSGSGVIPVVMIDGWISLVQRQDSYDGVELIENRNPEGTPNKSGTTVDSITAKFYLKGKSHPVVVTEYMDECYDGTKNPWKKWPIRMLRHKAYIQGARVAFGFSGIYDEDEKDRIQAGEVLDVPAETMIGLKNDKNKPAQVEEPVKTEEKPGEEIITPAEIVDDKPLDFGDLNRFGPTNAPKARNMLDQAFKIKEKLGVEKFMAVLGAQGCSMLSEISKFEDLVKFVNALLEEARKLEA